MYYGETVIINKDKQIVEKKEQPTEGEQAEAYKEVRHGNGIQLYEIDNDKCKCKYEGTWSFDEKHGKGVAQFSDGSVYKGEFQNDLFHGNGKFIWKSGHVYIGSWKEGKMDGNGEFKHRDGHILQGQFADNYLYEKELDIYVNPFLSMENLDYFYRDNRLNSQIKEKNSYQFTHNNIQFVYDETQYNSLINDCINSNYTPLLLRTIEKQISKEELFSHLQGPIVEINLKYYYMKLRECELISPEIKQIYDEIKNKFTDAFVNGKLLVLNFDDYSLGTYDKLFNPSIVELYGNYMFSPKMWRPKNFKEGNNFLEHTFGNEEIKLNPNFRFIVYSKFLIEDINAKEEQLVGVIEKYFGKEFPLKYIKIFILGVERKVEEVKPPEEPVEEPPKEEPPKKGQNKAGGKKK